MFCAILIILLTNCFSDPRYKPPEDPRFNAVTGLLPFFHIYGLICGLVGFIRAKKMIVMKSFDPELYLETIQNNKIELLHLVPPLANFLAKSPLVDKYDLSSVKSIICGAAPLSKKTEETLIKRLSC